MWSAQHFPFPLAGNAFQPLASVSIPLPLHKYHENAHKLHASDVNDVLLYQDKVDKAIWRGQASGYLFLSQVFFPDMKKTPREEIMQIAKSHPDLIDASFEKVPLSSLFNYRYVVALSGNTWASVLMKALSSNSVVLRQDPIMYQWFEQFLLPWEHFIPVKHDLSDLIEKVQWARANYNRSQAIAQRASEFVRSHLNEETRLRYVQSTLEYNMPWLPAVPASGLPERSLQFSRSSGDGPFIRPRQECTIVFANTWYGHHTIPEYPLSYGFRQLHEYGRLASSARSTNYSRHEADINARVCKHSSCRGTSIIVKYGEQFLAEADVIMYHSRDEFSEPMNKKTGSVIVQYSYENAAFGGSFQNKTMLKWTDHLSMPSQKVSVPIYTVFPPTSSGPVDMTPPLTFSSKRGFVAEVSSHCEPIRTEYIRRMASHSTARGYPKIASMGKCNHNDGTLKAMEREFEEDLSSNKLERRHLVAKAVAGYKFVLIFLNSDCEGWIDMRLGLGFYAGTVSVFMGTDKRELEKIWPHELMKGMIFAQDFPSPEALVDFLEELSRDAVRYASYMQWLKGYNTTRWARGLRFESSIEDSSCWWCDLCNLRPQARYRPTECWPDGTDFKCKRRKREWWLDGYPTPNGSRYARQTIAICRMAKDTCKKFIEDIRREYTSLPALSPAEKHKTVFLGDSTMLRLFEAIRRQLVEAQDIDTTLSNNFCISHDNCLLNEYLNVSKDIAWKQPDRYIEGPTGNVNHPGEIKPWCSDCVSCKAKKCGHLEYLPVEFARDVTIQTPRYATTQQLVGTYLTIAPVGLCIVNAGLHDMEIAAGQMTSQQYAENVHFYMTQLSVGCKLTVWLHTSSVLDEEKYRHMQNNKKIVAWNSAVERMLTTRHPHVKILDVFEFSNQTHMDNVHLNGEYYSAIGKLLAGILRS